MNEQAPSRAGPRPSAPLLQLSALTKSYGSTRASRQVSFDVGLGEIVALVGENGAGKSTLMGMMSGVVAPDSGEIRLDGEVVHLSSPGAAQAHGIATVFQELSLSPNLTVMENMFAGRPPTRFGLIDRSRLRADTDAVLQRFGLPIDPDALIGDLPVSSRQIVEIAKAVSRGARVLLLDEPTSALNAGEKQALFKVIETLRASGTGIIYISHHLDEVIALADRIVVLRDGAVVSITQKGEATPASLVRDMVGRDIETGADLARPAEGSAILSVSGVSHGTAVHDVSFNMRPGEIIALAGLMGAGRSELAHMVVGLSKPSIGSVTLLGKPVRSGGMRTARVDGIGYVPAERKSEGLFLDLPVSANIAATSLSRQSRAGVVVEKRIQGLAQKHIDRLSIKVDDTDPPVRSLSGGNQQKVLLAKWLEIEPRLLVLEEPTKGVDIGAKFDIHREIKQLAAAGAAVLVVSSDLPEILALSHRVLVMHQGRLVADLDARVTSEQQIVAYASGLQEVTHAVQ